MKRRYLYDSRLKRSTNGRATAWEIKMVLGYPATGQLPPGRYSGTVTPSGDVTVVDKRTGKIAGSMTNTQLSSLERQEAVNHSGMKVGAGYSNVGVGGSFKMPTYQGMPVVGYAAFAAQNSKNQNVNATQRVEYIKQYGLAVGSVLKITSIIAALGTLGDSLLGISKLMEALGKTHEGAKQGASAVAESAKKIKESVASLSKSKQILEKLKAVRAKM